MLKHFGVRADGHIKPARRPRERQEDDSIVLRRRPRAASSGTTCARCGGIPVTTDAEGRCPLGHRLPTLVAVPSTPESASPPAATVSGVFGAAVAAPSASAPPPGPPAAGPPSTRSGAVHRAPQHVAYPTAPAEPLPRRRPGPPPGSTPSAMAPDSSLSALAALGDSVPRTAFEPTPHASAPPEGDPFASLTESGGGVALLTRPAPVTVAPPEPSTAPARPHRTVAAPSTGQTPTVIDALIARWDPPAAPSTLDVVPPPAPSMRNLVEPLEYLDDFIDDEAAALREGRRRILLVAASVTAFGAMTVGALGLAILPG